MTTTISTVFIVAQLTVPVLKSLVMWTDHFSGYMYKVMGLLHVK